MMKVLRYIGHCVLRGNSFISALLCGLLLAAVSTAQAAPVNEFADATADALATAEGAWADSLLGVNDRSSNYDEQIFTELSPILDSLESIKLPEDQLLTD